MEGRYTKISTIVAILGLVIAIFAWLYPTQPSSNAKEVTSKPEDKNNTINKSNKKPQNYVKSLTDNVIESRYCDLNKQKKSYDIFIQNLKGIAVREASESFKMRVNTYFEKYASSHYKEDQPIQKETIESAFKIVSNNYYSKVNVEYSEISGFTCVTVKGEVTEADIKEAVDNMFKGNPVQPSKISDWDQIKDLSMKQGIETPIGIQVGQIYPALLILRSAALDKEGKKEYLNLLFKANEEATQQFVYLFEGQEYLDALSLVQDKKYILASEKFRLLASHGHIDSQRFLGDIYANGSGVEKDTSIAERWYRLSGDNDGLKKLGVIDGKESFFIPKKYKVKIESKKEKRDILKISGLSQQFVADKNAGKVEIYERDGMIFIEGEQKNKKSGDFVKIYGVIEEIDEKGFLFNGTTKTKIKFLWDFFGRKSAFTDDSCRRMGRMRFNKKTGKYKQWRLAQMSIPCVGGIDSKEGKGLEVAEYIDLFLWEKRK